MVNAEGIIVRLHFHMDGKNVMFDSFIDTVFL